jgi:SAM-dependent methyltransferase
MSEHSQYREWKKWDKGTFGLCNPIAARYFEVELDRAEVDITAKLALLEIGFGNGSLARWALDRNWTYVGTEIDPDLVERAQARGFEVWRTESLTDAFPGRCDFDVVVAFDVLEHLTIAQIVPFLKEIRRRLKPTGRFIARFPSGDSPFSRALQHGDMTHRSSIGSAMVEQLAISSGLRVTQIRAPSLPLSGVGVRGAVRRAALLAIRILIAGLLRLIYFDNQPRVIDPNMLIVLQPSGASHSDLKSNLPCE